MTTGAIALRKTGCHLSSLTGARRFGLVYSDRRPPPLFAVLWVQFATSAYYNPALPQDHPDNIEKRQRWITDVTRWETLATQMTERRLWSRVHILLVHVEEFSGHTLRRIWPPAHQQVDPPYPSHMNSPESAVIQFNPSTEMVRLVLEHSGSAVYPRLFYQALPENWPEGFLAPGLPVWVLESPVNIEVHEIGTGQWVLWAGDVLERIL